MPYDYRINTERKSTDNLFNGLNNACYRHLTNNPNLVHGNKNECLASVWNDPYINQKFISPLVGRHGEQHVSDRFYNICNDARKQLKGRV